MKFTLALSLLLALASAEFYSSENDNFDIDAVTSNHEVLKVFIECFLHKNAPCTGVPTAHIKDLPDAVQTACTKCNPIQKGQMRKFLEAVETVFPEYAKEFGEKYDPEGIYLPKLKAALAP